MEIEHRIAKDIRIFSENIKKIERTGLSPAEAGVVSLAEMYASDSKVFLEKRDYYTSFSSIAYAHGLLDAILKIKGAYGDEGDKGR